MIDHLSVSQLDMFTRCGEQWRRRYIDGEIIPPGIAARVGTGVHKAAELNFREKMESGEDLPLDVIQDAAAEAYAAALQNGVFFAPDEVDGAHIAMAEGKDTAVSLATVFWNELAPTINPAFVEQRVTLELGLSLPVVTVIDLYTQRRELRDLKTSGRRWTDAKARTSPQPTLYREAIRALTDEYPERIVFDVLVQGRNPELQKIETVRDADDLRVLIRQFEIMLMSVQAGIFPPAQPDSWNCSPRWCGYFYSCPYIAAHRKIIPVGTHTQPLA